MIWFFLLQICMKEKFEKKNHFDHANLNYASILRISSDQPILTVLTWWLGFVRKQNRQDGSNAQSMFELVKQWQQSGKSQKQFSGENHLKLSKFLYWVQKFRRTGETRRPFPLLNDGRLLINHLKGCQPGKLYMPLCFIIFWLVWTFWLFVR